MLLYKIVDSKKTSDRFSILDFLIPTMYFSLMERRFDRRQLGRYALAGTVAVLGLGEALESKPHSYFQELVSEHEEQEFITQAALQCANSCELESLPHSLAFDTSARPYKLVIPGLARAGLPNVKDGWDYKIIPMVAAGETAPPKPKRPEWTHEVLLNPVFKGPSDRPLVALTVDDGYFNREEILKSIIDQDVSATFLIVGSIMDQDPDFVRKANDSGRITWGNHTYTHADLSQKSTSFIQSELSRTEESLKRICGATTIPFMRPPGGARSNSSITAAANSGFRTFLWNVSGDAGTQWTPSNPKALIDYYMGLLDSQKNPWGSIILTHFRPATAVALPGIIKGIRERGMEPVSLDRLYEDGRT